MKIYLAEFIGTCFLLMIVVGSGIMGQNLTNNQAITLLANTISTGAGLTVLIWMLSKISGAHFYPAVGLYITSAYWFTSSTSFANPAITIGRVFSDTFTGIDPLNVTYFIGFQVLGALFAFQVNKVFKAN